MEITPQELKGFLDLMCDPLKRRIKTLEITVKGQDDYIERKKKEVIEFGIREELYLTTLCSMYKAKNRKEATAAYNMIREDIDYRINEIQKQNKPK